MTRKKTLLDQPQVRTQYPNLPRFDRQIDTKDIAQLTEYCIEARGLLVRLLSALDPANRLDPQDFREDLEEFLQIERQPSADVASMVRSMYGRTERLLLDAIYATAARNLVDPADVDATLKAMGAVIRPTSGGAKRVTLTDDTGKSQ